MMLPGKEMSGTRRHWNERPARNWDEVVAAYEQRHGVKISVRNAKRIAAIAMGKMKQALLEQLNDEDW